MPLSAIPFATQMVKSASSRVIIDFEKHFYRFTGQEIPEQKQNWTVVLPYTILPEADITNDMIAINPIGIQFQDVIETQGF